nr:dTDP-4-dehydrorhamnose reductase [Aestuariivirga litoralis]
MLLGGSGQVGFELQRALAPVAEVIAPGFDGLARADLSDFAFLENLVSGAKPDLVINAAAHTAVDKAETERELANIINAQAPGVLARAAKKAGAPFIHYSTDYVFDGSGDAPRGEDDVAKPLNHYGASKLAGEDEVRSENPQHLILRTSWVYAPHGKNFPKTMLRLAREKDLLQVVDDQFGAPTSAELVADATVHAALRLRRVSEVAGTYHLVASGFTSWHRYAMHLLSASHQQGLIPRLPKVEPVPAKQFATAAVRPQNSRLSNAKFQRAFGLRLPDWEQGVDRLVRELAKASV